MARTVKTSNQLSGPVGGAKYVTIHSDRTGSIRLTGVDASPHLVAATTGETPTKMHISKVIWGTANNTASAPATWTLARGANTVMILTGSGVMDFQEEGVRLESGGDEISNCVFTLAGGTGTIAIKFAKSSGAQ